MFGKQLYAVWPLGLALFISSCGSDAPPPDAVIKAVEADKTTTYTLNTVPTPVVDGAIHFRVQMSPTDTSPVAGVKVELSGSSPSVSDPAAGFVAGLSGGFLNPADPSHIEATTNGSGVVAGFYQFTVPKCSATDDLTVTASISASIGQSTATWIDNITVKKDPTC
jgi:hypothetical protein